MLTKSVAGRFLPRGGRLRVAQSVGGDVADAGAVQDNASVVFGETSSDSAEVIVDQDVCVLECDEGD
eukprot:10046692-Lingulodinium_polyedra.AAC.1